MMRPYLIFGNTDKAKFDFAKNIAKENNYLFQEVEAEKFEEELFKPVITSTLENQTKLYFIFNCEKIFGFVGRKKSKTLSERVKNFLDLIKDSPHKFILSTNNILKIHYSLREACMLKSLGEEINPLTEALKSLFKQKNRDLVREKLSFLSTEDFHLLLYLLKENCWRNPKALEMMEKVNQKVYKVQNEYLISLLAYGWSSPPIISSIQPRARNKELLNMKKNITELAKKFHTSKRNAIEYFYLLKRLPKKEEKKEIPKIKIFKNLSEWV